MEMKLLMTRTNRFGCSCIFQWFIPVDKKHRGHETCAK